MVYAFQVFFGDLVLAFADGRPEEVSRLTAMAQELSGRLCSRTTELGTEEDILSSDRFLAVSIRS